MRFSLSASLVGVVIAVTFTSVVHSDGNEMAPDAVRPGSCPMMIQGCPDNQPRDKTDCTSDSQCTSPLKCCSTPCGGAGCMQPDNLPEPEPTYCPDYRAMRIACDGTRVIERCIDNKNCTGGKICCRSPCGGTECFVGGTQKPETKPGECEPVNWASIQCLTMSDEDRQVECTRDTDCEGEKKCCDNPCTNQRCRDPQEVYKGDDQGDDNDDQSDDDDVKPTKPGHCYMHTMGCPAGAPADPIECDNDYNCTENLKCCSTSCFGMTCQKPQPGYCPDYRLMLVQSCNGTRETCIDDDSCTAGKLCCRSPCGGFECMEQVDYPPATKPGTCPYVPWELIDCAPMDEEHRQTECTQDYDCDGELKCCENACSNKRCKPKSERPGMCEDFSNIRPLCVQGAWENSTADCVDDQGCEGNKKCCQQLCVKPQCKAPLRAGRCPFTIQGCPSNATTAKPACVEDFDCPEDHKCCQDGCGNAVCSRADHEVRYGVCPAQTEMSCAPDTPKKDECQYDDDCLYGMKCCERNCQGKLCVYPDNEKEEETPYPSFVCPYWDASRNCLLPNDQECTVENKCADGSQCCQYECSGTRCESVLCPAPNPGVRCVMMNPLACNASDDCGDDSICCTYECGGRKCIKKDSVQTILPKVKPGECLVTTQGCVDIANRPNDTCKTDDDCKGSDKCCTQSCGNLQCVPAAIVDPGPVVHPGQCPANPLPPGMGSGSAGTSPGGPGSPGSSPGAQGIPGIECQVRCTNRTDCAAGQLCCNTGFFATRCMTNDQCPQIAAPAPGTKIPCSILCTDDVNCGVGNMCCRTGDGGTACREIQYDASGSPYCPRVMPPAPPTCRHTCDSDASCASNEKCCKNDCGGAQCVPVKDEVVVHPGQCPAGPVPSGSAGSGSGHCGSPGGDAALCTFRCTSDSQCNAGQKCCKNGFTGTTCWESGIDQCPVFSPPAPGTIINCTIHCSNDGDCGADSICCQTSSNTTQCIKKGQSGQSSCPQIMPPPPSTCPHTCDSDAPCAPNEKCCKNDCGGTQCYPVQDTPVPYPSFVCPYWDPNRACLVPNPQECKIGSLCDDGSQCCQYECSGTRCQRAMCPAPNPAIRCALPNPKTCNASDHCGTDGICCGYECSGRKCIKKEHPGTCPNTTGTIGTCAFSCQGDHNCSDSEKCCTNGCGGTNCMPTVESGNNGGSGVVVPNPPERQTPAPPVCPVFDPKTTCGSSGDKRKPHTCDPAQKCSDGGKCCQYECEGTRCETDLCPAPNTSINCFAQESRDCNKSADCGEDKKCCEIHCGGTRCFPREAKRDDGKGGEGNTQPPKQIDQAAPGTLVCPNNPSIRCTPALQKRSCSEDSQCGNKKCCDTGCDALKICQTPVRQGSCPVINVRCAQATSSDAENQCGTDMGCQGNQKCCNHPCPGFGTRCYEPVA